ncbi:MAG: hypothetical protein Q8K60_01840 [Parachlamydiaceae bacterium]|nr:hypothetical protein [Parachlamydiaceae bacterium]
MQIIRNNINIDNFKNNSSYYTKSAFSSTVRNVLSSLLFGSVSLTIDILKKRKLSVIKVYLNDIHKKAIRCFSMYFVYNLLNSIVLDLSLKIIKFLYENYNNDKNVSRLENKIFKIIIEIDHKIGIIFTKTFGLVKQFKTSSILINKIMEVIVFTEDCFNETIQLINLEEIKFNSIDEMKLVIDSIKIKKILVTLFFYKLIEYISLKSTGKIFNSNYLEITKTISVVLFSIEFLIPILDKIIKPSKSKNDIPQNVIEALLSNKKNKINT